MPVRDAIVLLAFGEHKIIENEEEAETERVEDPATIVQISANFMVSVRPFRHVFPRFSAQFQCPTALLG
jgi:hypothetical protein